VKRTAVLKHSLPDGSWHYDWLIQTDERAESPVLTFRTGHDRPDLSGSFVAERIGEHRSAYLAYEGPVSGNRGEVERVVEGEVVSVRISESVCEIVLVFAGVERIYSGSPLDGGLWQMVVTGG